MTGASKGRCVVVVGCTSALTACGRTSALHAGGTAARQTSRLAVMLFSIAGVVVAIIVVAVVVAIVRSRDRDTDPAADPSAEAPSAAPVVLLGAALPAVVLAAVLFISFGPLRSQARADSTLTVKVIGHRWWWEVQYPSGATTANQLTIPAGERVHIELTSDDVIHSFWVPALAGKRDAIPGRTTDLYLDAEKPGSWGGRCAEYCGLQHANMRLDVVALTRDDFTAWDARESGAAVNASGPLLQGQQIFLGASCPYCHTIEGTVAKATIGPDLTHVASRPYLAGGAIDNTQGALSGWILDPQRIKPGTLMPPTDLTGPELTLLVQYLESLK